MTLMELLVILALIVVLATLGGPALGKLAMDARMTAQVNRFVHGIHLARQEAHKRVQYVALCKSPDGQTCAHHRSWGEGWIVFVNRDRDDPPRVDAGEPVLLVNPAFADGTVAGNRQAFVFRPFRRRSTNGTLVFCDRRGPDSARAVIVSYTGRPRVSTRTASNKFLKCTG
jgi:type IV fimbrial biogenesis protein FimT